MTHTISKAFLAFAHLSISIERLSYFCNFFSLRIIKASHTSTHKATHRTTKGMPKYDSTICRILRPSIISRLHNASYINPKLAAIISDAAMAFIFAIVDLVRFLKKQKGNAHNHVHSAVINA